MSHQRYRDERTLEQILAEEREILRDDREILHELHPNITKFTKIMETTMTPLAAGQTATFATTSIPAGTAPDPAKIVWSSSDSVNAPVVVNPNDASGLSAQVTFPADVTAGLTFALIINYENSDGTFASQTNSFTTVAAPPADVTGFTPIVQSA